jgi:transposase
MNARTILLHPQTRARLKRKCRWIKDADTRMRYRIVIRSSQGHSGKRISRELGCSVSTISRTLDRYEAVGEAGLIDRREDNGDAKADPYYVETVRWILDGTPQEFFHRRPTWTKALLIETARRYTGGITVSKTTMGRVLRQIKARRGRAKPMAPCPWSKAAKQRRMTLIHALIGALPADQVCVWEDEADIDLNPRIGSDWTLPGQQRRVMTPGQNIKRYYAAAMDAKTDKLVWVKGERKNSRLFIELLTKLAKVHAGKTLIHVVLDNYSVHTSRQTNLWLQQFGQQFRLHFLPPYDPDDNRIERKVWREVHANVTINHQCTSIEQLCGEVSEYLKKHNRNATPLEVRESRRAI